MTWESAGGARPGDVDPFETLSPLVAAATVRIHDVPEGYAEGGPVAPPRGSGFFVAPGWVLTSAHVALRGGTGEREGREVALGFGEEGEHTVRGRVAWALPQENPGGGNWPAPDLALIRLLEPAEHACVWLTERTAKLFTRKEVAFFGCSEEGGRIEPVSGRCTIRGELGTEGWLRLGNEDEIPEGASGGPVVDLERGEVIGVLKARRSAGRDGGLATSVVQLRRLTPPSGPGADLYQDMLHAHDRHHLRRHRELTDLSLTWTEAQRELGVAVGHVLTPSQRAELLGRLAELPPPASTSRLDETVLALRGRPYEGRLPAPRGWRDGVGLLYDLRQGPTELEILLRYAVHAATADHPYPSPEGAEERVWEWVDSTAAGAGLSHWFRGNLFTEYRTRLRERRATASAGSGGRPADVCQETPGASVLLEIIPHAWEASRYDWRVCAARSTGELSPVDEGFRALGPGEPPERLRAALAEAFRRGDEPGRPVPLQVALPYGLLGFPVEEWRIPQHGHPLGVQRPVVVRCAEPGEPQDWDAAWPGDGPGGEGLQDALFPPPGGRPREDGCPGAGQKAGPATGPAWRRARWEKVHAGPMEPAVLDCADGRPSPVPGPARLAGREPATVPVLCRTPATGGAPDALRRVMTGGFDVVLWRREGGEHAQPCADFHEGATRTVVDAGRAGRLPGALRELRAQAHARPEQAVWSRGLALLYSDPSQPLPGADDPLEGP